MFPTLSALAQPPGANHSFPGSFHKHRSPDCLGPLLLLGSAILHLLANAYCEFHLTGSDMFMPSLITM